MPVHESTSRPIWVHFGKTLIIWSFMELAIVLKILRFPDFQIPENSIHFLSVRIISWFFEVSWNLTLSIPFFSIKMHLRLCTRKSSFLAIDLIGQNAAFANFHFGNINYGLKLTESSAHFYAWLVAIFTSLFKIHTGNLPSFFTCFWESVSTTSNFRLNPQTAKDEQN